MLMSLLKRTPLLLGLLGFLPTAASAGQYQNFTAAVYVRAYEVQLMKDPAWLRDNWAIVERQVKVDKVYLETHRDLIIVDDATLQQAKAFFVAKGLKVAGGIATVRNESNLFEVFCYTQAGQRAKMREIVEATARNFDEFIIDDFFFTSCTCDECIAAKGERSWTRFRLDLMKEVSRDLILKTARTVNPKVKVTLKYPNWYEHYQGTGYNLEDEPPLYDKIYTGTETRDPVHTGQHLQQYHSYEAFRYLENIKPGGNGGGWVDSGARGNADRYAEQFWLTMFAKAPEITLFAMNELLMPFGERDRAPWQGQGTSFDYAKAQARSAGSPAIKPTLAAVAGQALELADSVVGKLGQPIGLVAYKPFHSTGEDFIHNFLGMVGLPIEMVPQFPVDAPTVLLTESAKFDPAIVAKIKGQLRAGKNVVITTGLLRALRGRGIEDIAEIEVSDRRVPAQQFVQRGLTETVAAPIVLPEVRYLTNASWEIISTLASGVGHPVLLMHDYNKGKLYVLTVPDNQGDLYNYPPGVWAKIRELVLKDLFVHVDGPSQVALFAYDNKAFIVESFRDQKESVRITTAGSFTKLHDELTGQVLAGRAEKGKTVFDAEVLPHSFRVFTAKE